jgi:hypothetical protein
MYAIPDSKYRDSFSLRQKKLWSFFLYSPCFRVPHVFVSIWRISPSSRINLAHFALFSYPTPYLLFIKQNKNKVKTKRKAGLYNNMTMKKRFTNAPNSITDSSFASLDTDFFMNSDLVKSSFAAPKTRVRALPSATELTVTEPTVTTGPSTGGFCLTPKRGLGRRYRSQRHHLGFSACMVVTSPNMARQETFEVHVPNEQKRTSAAEILADRLGKLEAELRAKEKECLELRELVEACSHALPRTTLAGRKAASMTNLGTKSRAGKQQRQISSGLDSELTRESAEEKYDDFNDDGHRFRRASADASGVASKKSTSRVLPKRTMAGRMAASVRGTISLWI